jgi:hypothetical protein
MAPRSRGGCGDPDRVPGAGRTRRATTLDGTSRFAHSDSAPADARSVAGRTAGLSLGGTAGNGMGQSSGVC